MSDSGAPSRATKSVASLIAQQQHELQQAEKQQQQAEKAPRAVASYVRSRRQRGDSGSSATGGAGTNDDVEDESLGSVAATRVPSSRYRSASRGGSFHRYSAGVGMATTDADDDESSASTTSAAETALSTFGPVVKLNVGGTLYQTRLAVLRTV